MNGTVLTCTVCGAFNMFPIAHANMQERGSMTTFCNTCGTVTLQRVSGPSNQGDLPNDSTHVPTAPTQSSVDPYRRTPVPDTSEQLLWRRLQDALTNNNVAMTEFFRCDVPTKTRLITAMGFSSIELPKLLKLSEANDLRKILGSTAGQVQPQENSAEGKSPALGPSAVERNGKTAGTPLNTARDADVIVETPNRTTCAEGSVPGMTVQDDGRILARCSVYPHLPAEFWCSLCGALVSSRCHVSGIHKDHPFITLRQAAEAHVRDLKSWAERCRSQLNVASSIVANLQHGKEVITGSVKHQEEELDRHYEEIVRGLAQWRDELKSSMRLQVSAQLNNIDAAVERTNAFIEYYTERQNSCDPLLHTIPPVHQVNKQSEDWSLRVMGLVSHLKTVNQEPIPMPRLTIPEVKPSATVATYMDLLKAVSVPAGIRVPDVLDTGYLNFPNPSDVGRDAFTLQPPEDAKARGILIYSGRTLTRSQNITPTHMLVCASQIFYTGITAWEVHIDRLGVGPGRILAGVLMAGTDGEGVVWDGRRIVGPNEGECRALPDRYALQTGTTLRFVLELEAPSYFLICYHEDDVVARVPLPPALSGWIPAFSVFGPQDQVTVVPTSSTAAEHLLFNAVPAAKGKRAEEEKEEEAKVRLIEQEQKLNALQQQLLAVNSRIDQEQYERLINNPTDQRGIMREKANGDSIAAAQSPHSFREAIPHLSPNEDRFEVHTPFDIARDTKAPPRPLASSILSGAPPVPRGQNDLQRESYSPELRNLLSFVDSIK
ncbi:hypothetical protein DQ04_01741060 [Trypanosoma grayi]|uniref:hypothetical protein n=1 Tax=Trypanosoma grayi TaxID=71804 RepID=UPI0004F41117|nr:hypothetical protein DQ04_01741060 [Trypanosoma grayi]KEG12404.1 hypothetical protein DQ04_01741060 [Trypanosoma grayi]